MAKTRMAYDPLREPIEERGGSMVHVRKGFLYGAWIVTLGEKTRTFLSNGCGYPELDSLYVLKPGIRRLEHYKDCQHKLVDGAIDSLVGMLS